LTIEENGADRTEERMPPSGGGRMNRIRLLDEVTISQIAAGEVIERPASVVKELVENSLDAGAADIRIRVGGAGKDTIEVSDDGHGMSAEDVELAFRQHATSKLTNIEDLDALDTLGFRGEALSSIASVAEVEVSTKEEKVSIGISLKVRGGIVLLRKDVGRQTGSTITVNGLFTDVPARLKYLKSDRVEMSHIIQVVTERALAHHEVAFQLHNENVEVLRYARASTVMDRLTDVFGRRVTREMVVFRESGKGVSIEGFLAKPVITKSTAQDLHILVNRRPVASKEIVAAIEDGYTGLLMRNRHPVGALYITIDQRSIDVNVHPTKREIKFADIKPLAKLITKAVAEALGNVDFIPEAKPRTGKEVSVKMEEKGPTSGAIKVKERTGRRTAQADQTQLVEDEPCVDISESGMLPGMKVIGQIMDTYILVQSGSDLVIVDQHAAHERVMLERLKKAEKKGAKAAQNLITPVPLNINKREAQLIEHYRDIIEELGFKIEPFGKDTYLVRAVPVTSGHLEGEAGLLDLIHELAEFGKARSIEEKRDEIRHLVACHSAIRAGEKLSMSQMRRLIEEMHGVDNPYTCAHGRPTIIRITEKELERMFKRVV
jgi:DNA mismatch repair protein MutL